MWFEVWEADHVAELQAQGMHIERQLRLADGATSTLLRLTTKEALDRPYCRFCSLFFAQKPRFRFSFGEQRLLELALLEASDDQASKELCLSPDAIKKRWRSIYQKVETDPELLGESESGVARRRTLLNYLRQHLEELRPYNARIVH